MVSLIIDLDLNIIYILINSTILFCKTMFLENDSTFTKRRKVFKNNYIEEIKKVSIFLNEF